MIAAGVGCRRGCPADEIATLVRDCLAAVPADETVLFSAARKRDEAGLVAAAQSLGLPLRFLDDAALEAVQDQTVTRSERVAAAIGIASLAEAAALAGAGPGAKLILPRRASATATCALASVEPPR